MNKPRFYYPNKEYDDALTELTKNFSEREMRWLWTYLQMNGFRLPGQDTVPTTKQLMTITEYIINTGQPDTWITLIQERKKDHLLPDSEITWITKAEDRLIIWLYNRIFFRHLNDGGPINNTPPQAAPPRRHISTIKQQCNEIIKHIDHWDTPTAQKRQFITNLELRWSEYRSPAEQIHWISKKDDNQINWALSYLEKKPQPLLAPAPTNTEESYNLVIALIDQLSYQPQDTKTLFLDKMRKTWSQKKYRDSDKAKRQYSLPMTKETREKLHKISKERDETMGRTLERLINQESNRSDY